jgi:hypothetical protein
VTATLLQGREAERPAARGPAELAGSEF